MVKKQMQQEVEKLGLALYSGRCQDEYERRVMDIGQKSIKNPYIEWDIKYAELTVRCIAYFFLFDVVNNSGLYRSCFCYLDFECSVSTLF